MKKVPLLKKRESVLSYPYNPLKEKALITHSTQYKWWDEKSLLYLKKGKLIPFIALELIVFVGLYIC